MKNLSKMLFCISITLVYSLNLVASSEVRTIGEEAGKVYVIDQVDTYLLKHVELPAPVNSTVGPVSGALNVLQFGRSVDDFSKAKTDEQRLFATADATAAVLNIVVPGVGLVASLGILASKAIVANLSMSALKRMLEIQRAIEVEIKQQLKMNEMKLRSDIVYLNLSIERMTLGQRQVQMILPIMNKTCQAINGESDISEIQKCLDMAKAILFNQRIYVESVEDILDFSSKNKESAIMLDSTGLDLKALRADIEKYSENLDSSKKFIKILEEVYSKKLFSLLLTDDDVDSQNVQMAFFSSCLADLRTLEMLEVRQQIGKLATSEIDLLKNEINRSTEDYIARIEEKGCFEFTSEAGRNPFGVMVLNRKQSFDSIRTKHEESL